MCDAEWSLLSYKDTLGTFVPDYTRHTSIHSVAYLLNSIYMRYLSNFYSWISWNTTNLHMNLFFSRLLTSSVAVSCLVVIESTLRTTFNVRFCKVSNLSLQFTILHRRSHSHILHADLQNKLSLAPTYILSQTFFQLSMSSWLMKLTRDIDLFKQ